jgi:hypothetical protein
MFPYLNNAGLRKVLYTYVIIGTCKALDSPPSRTHTVVHNSNSSGLSPVRFRLYKPNIPLCVHERPFLFFSVPVPQHLYYTHTVSSTFSLFLLFFLPFLAPADTCRPISFVRPTNPAICQFSPLHQPWNRYTLYTITNLISLWVIVNVHNNRIFNRLLPKTQDTVCHTLWQVWQI